MRSPAFLLISCLIAAPVFAGDQTLITERTKLGMYIAPVFSNMEVDDDFGLLVGGRYVVVINHRFGIGLGGSGLVNEVVPKDIDNVEKLRMSYGGLILEYVFNSHEVLHFSIATQVGGGKISFKGDYEDEEGQDSDTYFIAEPEFVLELNISRNIRFAFGATYRYIKGADLGGLTDIDLRGSSAVATLKLGKF